MIEMIVSLPASVGVGRVAGCDVGVKIRGGACQTKWEKVPSQKKKSIVLKRTSLLIDVCF